MERIRRRRTRSAPKATGTGSKLVCVYIHIYTLVTSIRYPYHVMLRDLKYQCGRSRCSKFEKTIITVFRPQYQSTIGELVSSHITLGIVGGVTSSNPGGGKFVIKSGNGLGLTLLGKKEIS